MPLGAADGEGLAAASSGEADGDAEPAALAAGESVGESDGVGDAARDFFRASTSAMGDEPRTGPDVSSTGVGFIPASAGGMSAGVAGFDAATLSRYVGRGAVASAPVWTATWLEGD